jgi:hypothetical protein
MRARTTKAHPPRGGAAKPGVSMRQPGCRKEAHGCVSDPQGLLFHDPPEAPLWLSCWPLHSDLPGSFSPRRPPRSELPRSGIASPRTSFAGGPVHIVGSPGAAPV